jgi:hypothetical protein
MAPPTDQEKFPMRHPKRDWREPRCWPIFNTPPPSDRWEFTFNVGIYTSVMRRSSGGFVRAEVGPVVQRAEGKEMTIQMTAFVVPPLSVPVPADDVSDPARLLGSWPRQDDSGKEATVREGETVVGTTLGPYEILGIWGKGSLGVVYRARDQRLPRFVALMFLPVSRESSARKRFVGEAQAASVFSHANIATIHDIVSGRDLLAGPDTPRDGFSKRRQALPQELRPTGPARPSEPLETRKPSAEPGSVVWASSSREIEA